MKIKLLLGSLLLSNFMMAQVGVGTSSPKVTLHIEGKPSTITEKDGLLIPKITGDQLKAKTYTTSEIGTMIYISSIPTGTITGTQVEYVNAIGFYYLAASGSNLKWTKMIATSFDKTDDEWVNSGTSVILGKKADGTTDRSGHEQVAITDSGRLGLGTSSPDSGIHLVSNNDGYKDDIKIESYNSTPGANFLFFSGGYSNGTVKDILANNTIGQFNFHGRIGGNFNTSHARIFSTYKGTSGADITLSAGGASNSTLHVSENQRVGINTNAPRFTHDVNGFIGTSEQVFTIPSTGDMQNFSISSGQISITGTRSILNPFTIRLGAGSNGQRIVIVNNLTSSVGAAATISIVNDNNLAITILENTIAPGTAKEFIYSNNSWRAL